MTGWWLRLASLPRRVAVNLMSQRLGLLVQYAPRRMHVPPRQRTGRQMRWPKISVVTPSWNQGAFIAATLESVLGQEYPALEYLVRDGGSTDQTCDILRSHAHRLSGWVSQPDKGQADAINQGMAESTGEIMAWLNSDDLLLPGALHHVAEYFVRHPEVDVLYGDRLLINQDGHEIGRWMLAGHDGEVMRWMDFIPQETLFWRRSAWEAVGGLDASFQFALDWDLLLRFQDAGLRLAHTPRFLGAFRVHQQQKTLSQMSGLGLSEIERLLRRTFGRIPPRAEIDEHTLAFRRASLRADWRWRLRHLSLR